MPKKSVTLLMMAVGIIHLLPLLGVLGIDSLNALYDVDIAGNDLEILMRHRAILFGLLGGFVCFAALTRTYLPAAFVMAGISIVSFLILAFTVGDYNAAIMKVIVVDVIALICLITAVMLHKKT